MDLYTIDGPATLLGPINRLSSRASLSLKNVEFLECRAAHSGIVDVASESARLERCAFRGGRGSYLVSRIDASAFVYSDPKVEVRVTVTGAHRCGYETG